MIRVTGVLKFVSTAFYSIRLSLQEISFFSTENLQASSIGYFKKFTSFFVTGLYTAEQLVNE